jgi:hypothetical protein
MTSAGMRIRSTSTYTFPGLDPRSIDPMLLEFLLASSTLKYAVLPIYSTNSSAETEKEQRMIDEQLKRFEGTVR